MSRRLRRLSMLPTCAGLLLGLGVVACSDRADDQADDDVNQTSEYSTTTPADGTTDSATMSGAQGGTVAPGDDAASSQTARRTTTRRSPSYEDASADARVDARAEVRADDPYAPDVSRQPSRRDAADVNAEARVDVSREQAQPTREDVTIRRDSAVTAEDSLRANAELDVTARAESPRVDVNAPSADVSRRGDTASVSVTTPSVDIARRTDSVTVRTDTIAGNVAVTRRDSAYVSAAPEDRENPARADANADAPLTPIGPAAKGFMNDPQIINVLLLANSGDSARAVMVTRGSTGLAAGEADKKDDSIGVRTTSLGGNVAPAPAARRTVRVDTTDFWPSRNMHDDPKPRTRSVEVEMPAEPAASASARVTDSTTTTSMSGNVSASVSAPMNPVTPGVSVTTDASGATVITVAEVRAFAEQMVRDHTATNARLAELVNEDRTAPTRSEKSDQVFDTNRRMRDEVRPVTDDASARVWLEREARMHQQALDDIERQMLPLAHDDELRSILEDTRRTVQSHLTQARRMLGQSGTAMDTTRDKTGMEHQPMHHRQNMMPGDSMRMRGDSLRMRNPADTSRTRMPNDTTGRRPEPAPERYPY